MSRKGSLGPFARCVALLSKMLASSDRVEEDSVAEAEVDDLGD